MKNRKTNLKPNKNAYQKKKTKISRNLPQLINPPTFPYIRIHRVRPRCHCRVTPVCLPSWCLIALVGTKVVTTLNKTSNTKSGNCVISTGRYASNALSCSWSLSSFITTDTYLLDWVNNCVCDWDTKSSVLLITMRLRLVICYSLYLLTVRVGKLKYKRVLTVNESKSRLLPYLLRNANAGKSTPTNRSQYPELP